MITFKEREFSSIWNRVYYLEVQPPTRHIIQILNTNSILRYVTYDVVQRGWVVQMTLILIDLDIKIGTDRSSTDTPLRPQFKVAHIIEEIILCLLIIIEPMSDKVRGVQHKGRKRSVLHSQCTSSNYSVFAAATYVIEPAAPEPLLSSLSEA